jgi:VWFA-related protein
MKTVSRHAAPLVFALIGLASLSEGTPLSPPPHSQEPPPQRIRVAVDVVAVDVQVIDRTGRPVPDLGPEKFTVTINGRRRRVVSAEQIRSDTAEGGEDFTGAPSSTVPGRLIMLAVDCISFDATASRDVIQSVRQFVQGLLPDDHVGLSAYPNGAQIAPTRDHAAVLRALNTVVGQRDGPGLGQFSLRPTEVIDISRDISSGSGATLDAVVARECGQDADPNCRFRLLTEVTNTALYYEGQATASLGMLRTLVTQMRGYPGRKTLLLVSGGMIASDRPGGRPDLGSLGLQIGREAAAANTAIYTLFIDSSMHSQYAAETRAGIRTATNLGRDTAVLARWLEQFTGAAGGALFTVLVGNADLALARIRTELSSYYLLGVEPADEDRDGRTHEVAVRVRHENVTIRGRRWVMIPKRGVATAAPEAAAPAPAAPDSPIPPEAARPPVPADVAALAQAFDRGNSDAFQGVLAQSRNLAPVIRGFRLSDSPWPDDRRRSAIFALELAFAGLRSGIREARDEGGRLLAEYHVRVREPAGADAFECWWLLTQATALTGLFRPEDALLFIPRAVQRCPATGRLHLAYAVVSEQQWLRGATGPAQETEILSRYAQAMTFPEVETEARVRAARFRVALGQLDEALTVIDGITTPSADVEIRYLTHLVHGQLLRARGRMDDAAARFRAALAEWPGAQSAQVALMTLLFQDGRRAEAAALADALQTAPLDQYDPWWMYWLGDYRIYPAILDTLRELGR